MKTKSLCLCKAHPQQQRGPLPQLAVQINLPKLNRNLHQHICKYIVTGLVSGCLYVSAVQADAISLESRNKLDKETVEYVSKRKQQPDSLLPNSKAQRAMMQHTRDMFTEDAWIGMQRIAEYSEYVEGLGDTERSLACSQCEENRKILEKTWQTVSNEFYDPSNKFSQAEWAQQLKKTLQANNGAIRSKKQLYKVTQQMVSTLGDKYTAFLPPTSFRKALSRPLKAERDYLAAQYVGVGLLASNQYSDIGYVVQTPLPGSPAEYAGIESGDILVSVNQQKTTMFKPNQLENVFRGPVGSTLVLTIAKKGDLDSLRVLEVERKALPQPPVHQSVLNMNEQGKQVQYLRLLYVSNDCTTILKRYLQNADVDDNTVGIILDLRNNAGGVFEEAIAIASYFLKDRTLIATTIRNEEVVDNAWIAGQLPPEVVPYQQSAVVPKKPVVLLVNNSTASAAEVLSGALKDNHRAELLGTQTYGKGVVQYYFPMTDGSGLKVTVAKYLTPSGWDITKQGGLHPDNFCDDYPHIQIDQDRCVQQGMQIIRRKV